MRARRGFWPASNGAGPSHPGPWPITVTVVDPDLVVTSEHLRAYKPAPEFYRRARARIGPHVHVAASGRDVRGVLEAGVPCVRLRRPGHHLDPGGPVPGHIVSTAAELPGAVLDLALEHARRRTPPPGLTTTAACTAPTDTVRCLAPAVPSLRSTP